MRRYDDVIATHHPIKVYEEAACPTSLRNPHSNLKSARQREIGESPSKKCVDLSAQSAVGLHFQKNMSWASILELDLIAI